MKVITTPWKDTFLELISNCKESIKITSPYIKENVCDEMLSIKNSDVKLEVITSFKLGNIHSGSLDINAIDKIINSNGIAKNHSTLHSKIYLFDEKEVIISSGNLTNGGLLNNFEYGIYSNDIVFVNKVVSDFNLISNDHKTGEILSSHIIKVKEILSKMPVNERIIIPNFDININEEKNDILKITNDSITSSLTGWKLEVFKCVDSISEQTFSLNKVYEFENDLKKIYPENENITHKIRQQLQYLRDLGLIEFLGNGKYRKLWL